MDILNWLYLVKNNFVRTTPSSENDLLVLGAKVGFNKRGDKYQNYALSIGDLATSTASTLGVTSGTYEPEISTSGGESFSNVRGFYTKVGKIVHATIYFEVADIAVGGTLDVNISIPVSYDPATGDGFASADQARGVFMRYNPATSAASTENKISSLVGRDEIRLQYNNGKVGSDAIQATFTYEVL